MKVSIAIEVKVDEVKIARALTRLAILLVVILQNLP